MSGFLQINSRNSYPSGMIRRPKGEPIIKPNWKKALFVGIIVTLGLVLAATLCSQGVIHLSTDSWQFKAIAGIAGIMGISQVITLIGFFIYYRLERKSQEKVKNKLRQAKSELLQAENQFNQNNPGAPQYQSLNQHMSNTNRITPPQSSLISPSRKTSDLQRELQNNETF